MKTELITVEEAMQLDFKNVVETFWWFNIHVTCKSFQVTSWAGRSIKQRLRNYVVQTAGFIVFSAIIFGIYEICMLLKRMI